MVKLAVIADDLTGAGDTGVQFSQYGLTARIILNLQATLTAQTGADILVLDTDSRADSAAQAYTKVKHACCELGQLGLQALYKKIDSTLRGNIGAEVLAAWEAYQPGLTIIAPAYPKARRQTVGGHQLIDGIPVSLTEFSQDLKTPVTESSVLRLLDDYRGHSVELLSLKQVLQGRAAVKKEIKRCLEQGNDWIVCDAVLDDHLRTIVEAAADFGRVLWVGSAGLAEQIPAVYGWKQASQDRIASLCCRSIVVAAGSVSAVTHQQLRYYTEQTAVRQVLVDAVQAMTSPEQEGARLISEALRADGDIVIACSNEKRMLEKSAEAGKKLGLSANDMGKRIADTIAIAVAELVKQGVDGLFLTGGETAISCCLAIGAEGIEIQKQVLPGIPIGFLSGGHTIDLPVITKAGAFGGREAIFQAVQLLKGQGT